MIIASKPTKLAIPSCTVAYLLLAYSVHLNFIFDYLFLLVKERLQRKTKNILSLKVYLKTIHPNLNRSNYQFTFEALVC